MSLAESAGVYWPLSLALSRNQNAWSVGVVVRVAQDGFEGPQGVFEVIRVPLANASNAEEVVFGGILLVLAGSVCVFGFVVTEFRAVGNGSRRTPGECKGSRGGCEFETEAALGEFVVFIALPGFVLVRSEVLLADFQWVARSVRSLCECS